MKQAEQAGLRGYTEQIETLYLETRTFKHGYLNILLKAIVASVRCIIKSSSHGNSLSLTAAFTISLFYYSTLSSPDSSEPLSLSSSELSAPSSSESPVVVSSADSSLLSSTTSTTSSMVLLKASTKASATV